MDREPLTARSRVLTPLFPIILNVVQSRGLVGAAADDVCQEVLIALAGRTSQLAAMTESERAAYVWVTARRLASRARNTAQSTTYDIDVTSVPAPSAALSVSSIFEGSASTLFAGRTAAMGSALAASRRESAGLDPRPPPGAMLDGGSTAKARWSRRLSPQKT